MPTYEYECQKCHAHQEAHQAITAKPLTKCTKCGGKLKRLISSGSGFLFKRSGFYITDYRSKSYTDAKKKDQPSSTADAKKKDQPASSCKTPSSCAKESGSSTPSSSCS